MGGQGSGRERNQKGRRLVTKLCAQGLTLQEIGRNLGVSRQRVERLLADAGPLGKLATCKCQECGAVIGQDRRPSPRDRQARCLACLSKCPEATFGERVLAARLTAGMSKQELADRGACRKVGSGPTKLESQSPPRKAWPSWSRSWGVELVNVAFQESPPAQRRGGSSKAK